MKSALAVPAASDAPVDWPDAASLAALRGWYEGMPSRDAVSQYLAKKRAAGESSRAIIGRIKRSLVAIAIGRGRRDVAQLLG